MLQAVAVLAGEDALTNLKVLHQAPEIRFILCPESSRIPILFIQDIFVEGVGFRLHGLTEIKLV